MANPPPIANPWVWSTVDRYGNPIGISASFNASTRALTTLVLYRHPQCEFSKILIGLGGDNRPNSSNKALDVPAGRTLLPAAQLTLIGSRGVATIENLVNAFQMTAA